MKIIKLSAENVKRLKAVEITPDGTVQVITGRNAQGKAQPLSEPVLTPDGWKPMAEIKAGGQVITSAGVAAEVLGVFPQMSREVWEVRFADGSSTRCSPDHLWTVSSWQGPTWTEQTLTTAQILESGLVHRGHARRWAVPLVAPIERARLPLPIDPYALGVILGDGHIASTGYVQISTDTEILDEILDGLGVDGWYRRPARGCEALGTGEWSFRLEDLGLCGKKSDAKFVPAAYLVASIEQRQALLAGLLDTDGSPLSGGSAEFGSTSQALADAVMDLVRSLGGVAKKGAAQYKRYTYKGEKRQSELPFWRVLVRTDENPFRLTRKAERWTAPTSRRPVRRFIDSIERVADEDTQCILVDSPDHLYVTRDYIVTHNTSVLDAIWLALGGRAASRGTVRPIRDGEDHASVTLDLGDLVVTRTWSGDVSTLTVKTADGAKYSSPQTVLDALVGRLSFDPLEFTRLSAREQVTALLDIVNLDVDLDELARERQETYDRRTDVGRHLRSLGEIAKPVPAPDAEVSASDLIARIRDAQALVNRQADELQGLADAKGDLSRLLSQVEELELVVAAWKTAVATHTPMPDVAAMEVELDTLEDTNRNVRFNAGIAKAIKIKANLTEAYEDHTAAIAEIDKEKADALAAATFPVDGLGFDDLGVTYQGVPFSQASSAEQIRVSLAMAMALNPKLRVIRIMDGSLLDAENLALIAEMAAEHDTQVWIETVSDASGVGVVIEDGSVA